MDVLLIPRFRDTRTDVNVVFTTAEGTRAALVTTASFSKGLKVSVRVLAFQVVPYPLDIDKPAVSREFAVNQILSELCIPGAAEFTLQYALCRDQNEAL